MSCALCMSGHQGDFAAEVHVHLPRLADADKPGVFVFPKVLVCLNCGFSAFTTPASELAELARAVPTTKPSTRQEAGVAPHFRVAG